MQRVERVEGHAIICAAAGLFTLQLDLIGSCSGSERRRNGLGNQPLASLAQHGVQLVQRVALLLQDLARHLGFSQLVQIELGVLVVVVVVVTFSLTIVIVVVVVVVLFAVLLLEAEVDIFERNGPAAAAAAALLSLDSSCLCRRCDATAACIGSKRQQVIGFELLALL